MQHAGNERNNCSSCSVTSCHVPTPGTPDKGAMRGGKFVIASAGVFLIPVFAAVLGASIFSASGLQQFLVGGGGLLGGMLLTMITSRFLTRGDRDGSSHE